MVDKSTPSVELLAYRLGEYDALAMKLNLFLDEMYVQGEGDQSTYEICMKCEKRRRLDAHAKDCFIGKLDHIVWWGIPTK